MFVQRLRKVQERFTLTAMYTPAVSPIDDLILKDPYLNHPAVRILRPFIPLYMRALGLREPILLHGERMIEAYRRFQNKSSRLIIGFRHAYGDDAQVMIYTLHASLPRLNRASGRPLKSLIHAHFIHGSEVPLWSGPLVRWALPRGGAVPVNHVHMDAKGMNRIRSILSAGTYPLALAPEGHVTHASDRIAELETGTARFAFWCIEDLAKSGRSEKVEILPVSLHYRYGKKIHAQMDRLLREMEKQLDLNVGKSERRQRGPEVWRKRLRLIAGAVYQHLEELYDGRTDYLEAMLERASAILGLPQKEETLMQRTYRIRQAAWDALVRNDLPNMNPFRRLLANRKAGEAWYAMRHLESAQIILHTDLKTVDENATLEQCAELAANLYDLIQRLMGGTLGNRSTTLGKTAVVIPAEPIIVNDYLELYGTDKRTALQKVTDDLRERFKTCIEEYKNEK